MERVKRGQTRVGHVPDVENPSDWLTKAVGKEKNDRSMLYATNFNNLVMQTVMSTP